MRPYEWKCEACGQQFSVHAIVDSEVWERISGGSLALCPNCIDDRLYQLGMRVDCDLQYVGRAMRSIVTPRVERAGAWRIHGAALQESSGLPALFSVVRT